MTGEDRQLEAVLLNDERDALELLAAFLGREFKVHKFMKPSLALDFLEQHGSVDLLLLDLYMPKVDGWDFARLVTTHEEEAIRKIPVVICSSIAGGPDAEQLCLENGARGLLPFPTDAEPFLQRIWELLAGNASDRERILVSTTQTASALGRSLVELLEGRGFLVEYQLAQEVRPSAAYDHFFLTDDLPRTELVSQLEAIREFNPRAVAFIFSQDTGSERVRELSELGADLVINYQVDARELVHLIRRERRRRELYHTYGLHPRRLS